MLLLLTYNVPQERKSLVSQIEQVNKLQDAAENEADKAITQLEEFINEQEKLVCCLDFLNRSKVLQTGTLHKSCLEPVSHVISICCKNNPACQNNH